MFPILGQINATYGGYYSGFDTKPEIVTDKITVANSNCIPNVKLKISTLSSYDTFQWYFNDNLIVGVTNEYTNPTRLLPSARKYHWLPKYSTYFFRQNPVSSCPEDTDSDGQIIISILILDNDGILNTQEAVKVLLNQSNPFVGTDFTGTQTGTGIITGKPVYAFVSEIPAGITSISAIL
jgi:hypothetical protein